MVTKAIDAKAYFADLNGSALDNGYLYVGQPNQNPILFPIAAYWDVDLTIPATQPVRTMGGYIVNNGQIATLYTDQDRSVLVQNKQRAQIYYEPYDTTGIFDFMSIIAAGQSAAVFKVEKLKGESDSLESLTGMIDGAVCQTLGYWDKWDLGHGVYRYDSSSTATVNGGTVISAAGGVGRWLLQHDGTLVDKQFGVRGDNIVSDTAALQALFNSAAVAIISDGVNAKTTAQIDLKSNLKIRFNGNGKITQASGDFYIFQGTSLSNIEIENPNIEGNGVASGLSACHFTSCTNIKVFGGTIKKARAMGLRFLSCTDVWVYACDLSQNYAYGVEAKQCINDNYINCKFNLNGNTGVATGAGGRGVTLWMCSDSAVIGNKFTNNTEYGFRLYSQTGDADDTKGARVIGNYFKDNAACDVVVYSEISKLKRNVISSNVIERTTDPTLGGAFLIQGEDVRVSDTHIFKAGAIMAGYAFQFYQTTDCSLHNCSAQNVSIALSFSGVAPNPTRSVVDGFIGDGVATITDSNPSTGTKIRNSEFYHGGAGASDVGITNYNTTGKCYYENLLISGFHTGIYIDTEAVSIKNVTTVGSTFAGLRKTGDSLANQEFSGNTWDSATPSNFTNLTKLLGKAVLYAATAPTANTWAVGDRAYNSSPSVGNPKSWVCTAAGTPGTWTSEGNL